MQPKKVRCGPGLERNRKDLFGNHYGTLNAACGFGGDVVSKISVMSLCTVCASWGRGAGRSIAGGFGDQRTSRLQRTLHHSGQERNINRVGNDEVGQNVNNLGEGYPGVPYNSCNFSVSSEVV